MKKNLLYIFLIFITINSCVRELGDKFTLSRRPIGSEFITSNKAYMYACSTADVLKGLAVHDADFETEIFNINNDSIKILKAGYCWIYEGYGDTPFLFDNNVNYSFFVDSISSDTVISAKIAGLGMDSVYFVRSFIIAEDLRWHKTDTGYNQTVLRIRTLLPENLWIKKDDYWGGNRQDAVSFVLNNEAYIFGGFDGLNLYNDTWKYNPDNDTWQQVGTAGASQKGRRGAVSFIIDDEAWVGLGETDVVNNKLDSTFIYYTSATNSWREKYNEFPESRKDAIGFTLQIGNDQVGFVGFGKNSYGFETSDLYKYLQEADTAGTQLAWQQVLMTSPPARTGATVTVIENRAFMFGGEDNGVYKNDFWMFDGVSQYPNGTWQKLADFPGAARSNAVSFSLEYTKLSVDYKVIYVGTGRIGNNDTLLANDFYKYDIGSQQWSPISHLGGPGADAEPRENAVAFDIVKDHDEYGIGVFNRGFVGTGRTKHNIAVRDFWEYFP
jgi:N-acetylneuraminic acid mutarotase